MHIEQIYTGCLAQGAYYIESNGEAAIIDPLRDVQPYLDRAAQRGATIKYIFETHFHADFVSGHLTLAQRTGAPIVFGPGAATGFDAHIGVDKEHFSLGDCRIELLHTPGHTLESSCYLLYNPEGKPHALFSGDTLFLGDVGRPDLAQKAAHMTQEELAGMLYQSLRDKIMPLPDDVIVYPAHGAGSACGKNLSKETSGTLGQQKATNYALRPDMSREDFIREVTDGLLPPPAYFPMNVRLNKTGYPHLEAVLAQAQPLSPEAFEHTATEHRALVLDVRHQDDFCRGHIPGSIFIGLDGTFAPWVGALIHDEKQPILLVTPEGRELEAVKRLSRVGYDSCLGYLEGGFDAWLQAGKSIDHIEGISAFELTQKWAQQPELQVYDVRKPGEFESEHLTGAHSVPLDFIDANWHEYPQNQTVYIHCAGGYRSVIAASILKARGMHQLVDVKGGYGALKLTDWPKVTQACSKS